jgi:hypothetical protein
MNETCTIALGVDKRAESGRIICGDPAVDWADIHDDNNNWFRIYFCADHLHMREHILALQSGSQLPFDPLHD